VPQAPPPSGNKPTSTGHCIPSSPSTGGATQSLHVALLWLLSMQRHGWTEGTGAGEAGAAPPSCCPPVTRPPPRLPPAAPGRVDGGRWGSWCCAPAPVAPCACRGCMPSGKPPSQAPSTLVCVCVCVRVRGAGPALEVSGRAAVGPAPQVLQPKDEGPALRAERCTMRCTAPGQEEVEGQVVHGVR